MTCRLPICVEVAFAGDLVEGEMIRVCFRAAASPASCSRTGINGPQARHLLAPRLDTRVMVRANEAIVARRLLAEATAGDDLEAEAGIVAKGEAAELRTRRVLTRGSGSGRLLPSASPSSVLAYPGRLKSILSLRAFLFFFRLLAHLPALDLGLRVGGLDQLLAARPAEDPGDEDDRRRRRPRRR